MTDANDPILNGLKRGAAASTAIVQDMSEQADNSADFYYGYLASCISGLLGTGAAAIGHDRVRALLKEVENTVEAGLRIIEYGGSARVQ